MQKETILLQYHLTVSDSFLPSSSSSSPPFFLLFFFAKLGRFAANGRAMLFMHHMSKSKSQSPFSNFKSQIQQVQFHPTKPYFFLATQRSNFQPQNYTKKNSTFLIDFLFLPLFSTQTKKKKLFEFITWQLCALRRRCIRLRSGLAVFQFTQVATTSSLEPTIRNCPGSTSICPPNLTRLFGTIEWLCEALLSILDIHFLLQ
jgi:hypothetical protein